MQPQHSCATCQQVKHNKECRQRRCRRLHPTPPPLAFEHHVQGCARLPQPAAPAFPRQSARVITRHNPQRPTGLKSSQREKCVKWLRCRRVTSHLVVNRKPGILPRQHPAKTMRVGVRFGAQSGRCRLLLCSSFKALQPCCSFACCCRGIRLGTACRHEAVQSCP